MHSLNNYMNMLLAIEVAVFAAVVGMVIFGIWAIRTWVISHRYWCENDIMIRRASMEEGLAKAAKLRLEAKALEHELKGKGILTESTQGVRIQVR